MADKPSTTRYVIDRPVYHTPGKQPHLPGAEVDFNADDVAHLVDGGYMHRKGTEPLISAVGVGQAQISQPQPTQSIAAPMAAAPLNYASKPADQTA